MEIYTDERQNIMTTCLIYSSTCCQNIAESTRALWFLALRC